MDTLPTAKASLGPLLGRAFQSSPCPAALLSRALLWDSSSVPLEAEGFGLGRKVMYLLWLKRQKHFCGFGPWVLIAACFDHLSTKLLWMCLRANKQVLMLILCSFCCCWVGERI